MTTVEERLAALEARVAKLESAPKAATSGGEVADDRDLDGQWGDEEIKRMPSPKYWPGTEDFLGKRMSQCSAQFLDAFAKYKDACAFMKRKEPKGENDLKYAGYDEKSARRARGWAARIRAGKVQQAAPDAATTEAARYGTSGHGASAKHAVTPEPAFAVDDFGGEDDIPF